MNELSALKKHKFIIIGIDHYNPLGVARSLGIHGIFSILIIKKKRIFSSKIASASKYVKTIFEVDSFDEVPELLLSKYGNEEYKSFVYPCDDVATMALDKKYDLLKDHFYIENCGIATRIGSFMEKEVQNKIAEKHGFHVAKTWDVSTGNLYDDIEYPVITKPFESYDGWKKDYYICNNESELKEAMTKVKGKVFVQQYIHKANELCVDGLVINKGMDNLITIASTYTYLLPDYYSMEMIVTNFDDSVLRQKIDNMFSDIGYEGIYCIEFLIDEQGNKWFLEINFRNSGWSWASTCVGMNLPILWAEGMLYGKIPADAIKKVPDHFIALAEISDFDQRVRKHKMISVKEWVKKVKRADCLYYYDREDPRPALSIWTRKLLRMVLKRR